MSKSKSIAIILLFAFIFNLGFMEIGISFAEENPGETPILYPPRIESVYPNFGGPGTEITISGEYFQPDKTGIKIGDKILTKDNPDWISQGVNLVKIRIPADISGTVVPIEVSTDGGTAKLNDAFSLATSPNPAIENIRPNTGGIRGGTPVTISGDNFRQDVGSDGRPQPPEVRFGDQLATNVIVISTKEIIAISPAATGEGKVKVSVKNPNQTTWVDAPQDFEYIAEGKLARILNITPNEGTMDGGTPISIRGVNFPTNLADYKNLEILIGDVPVTGIEIEPYGFTDEEGKFVHHKDENDNEIYIIHAITGSSKFSGKQDVQLLVEWADDHPKNGRTEIDILADGFTYYIPKSYPKIKEVINTFTGTNVGPIGGGHRIEIRGSGFEAGAEVYFGEKLAEEISLTGALITVRLPKGDIAGPVDVLVRNKTQGEITGEFLLVRGFTYRGTSMKISAVTPNYASTAEIKNLVITGENFNEDTLANTTVYFEYWVPDPDDPEGQLLRRETLNKVNFDPSVGTILTADTPNHPASGWKDLVVENSYGRAILRNAFEFRPPDIQPEILSVTAAVYEGDIPPSPRGSTAGGTSFIIKGNNFTTGTKVYVGGKLAISIDVRSFNEIEAVSPSGEPGWKDVVVEGLTGKTDVMKADENGEPGKQGFYYYSEPKINNVSPSRGSIKGDNIITITGEQFYPGAKVNFGYFDAENKFISVTEEVVELVVVNDKTIKLRLPALKADYQPGEYKVQVVNSDERTALWSKNFLLKMPDLEREIKIHSVAPAIGQVEGGTKVTIRGENFHPDAVVHFGWAQASIQSVKGHEIVVIAPPNQVGKYAVTVSNYADTGTAVWEELFEYLDPSSFPKITGIFPGMGPIQGGTRIIITGIGFWPGAKLFIGGRPASEVEANYTYITAETPEGDRVGPADVMVINPDGGVYTLADGFTYKYPDSAPEIVSVDPNIVPAGGGTIVTIEGRDFRKDVTVYFGSEKAEILEFTEPNTIIVKAPPYTLGEEGIVDVTVLNRDGGIAQSKTDEQRIRYFLAKSEPVIDRITPARGPAAGGTRVIIEGDGFSSKGVKVYFGAKEATLDAPIRYDRLEVIAPPGAPGSVVHVTVTNTDPNALGSGTLYRAFTYDASKPVITSVAPNQATYLGGTQVTIKGQGFTRVGAKVFIGEWEGLDVNVLDSETITFVTPRIAERPEDLVELKWWDVRVVNADGIEVVKEKAFRYLFPDSEPRIISIDPKEGSTLGGMPLTIIGTDFRLRAKVVIGGKEAEILGIDDSPGEGNAKIIVRTPPHTAGEKDVTVINYEGAISNSVKFTYVTPLSFPEITGIEPKQGPTLGDTEVIITGIGFKEGAKVWFGMYEAEQVEFVDYKTLKAITPPGQEGIVDVLMLNPDMGQATLTKGFRYIKAKEFVVNSITPNEGTALGGTAILIKGGPFEPGVAVHIGDEPAIDINRLDGETISAITPPGEIGWQEVKIKNPDGGFVVIEEGFYYIKPRTAPETPDWLDTTRKDSNTIEVSWEPAEFANYYEIWVSNSRNGKYVFLDQTTKTVYYATSLDLNKTYYFQIRAINELGVSGFSYYSYSRTGAGKEIEADLIPKEISIQAANGVATAVIATRDNLLYTAYRVDFDREQYRSFAKKIVRISQDALLGIDWPITVDAPNIKLSIHPLSLFLGTLGRGDAYAELILADLGQQEAEKALKELPRGSRIISPVYAIEWQILNGSKKTPQTEFYQQINLTMKYNAALTTGKEISIYTYNPASGKWVNTGAAHNIRASQLTLGTKNTGRFVLVEH